MTLAEALAVLAGAVAAGGVNTIVGSGSLITFPTLLADGSPSVVANVSNSVGLVPGGISGSRFLNLVMRGEHLQTLGTAPDDEIAIAPDAGRLLVQHLRPVDNDPPDTSMTAGRDRARRAGHPG